MKTDPALIYWLLVFSTAFQPENKTKQIKK